MPAIVAFPAVSMSVVTDPNAASFAHSSSDACTFSAVTAPSSMFTAPTLLVGSPAITTRLASREEMKAWSAMSALITATGILAPPVTTSFDTERLPILASVIDASAT